MSQYPAISIYVYILYIHIYRDISGIWGAASFKRGLGAPGDSRGPGYVRGVDWEEQKDEEGEELFRGKRQNRVKTVGV